MWAPALERHGRRGAGHGHAIHADRAADGTGRKSGGRGEGDGPRRPLEQGDAAVGVDRQAAVRGVEGRDPHLLRNLLQDAVAGVHLVGGIVAAGGILDDGGVDGLELGQQRIDAGHCGADRRIGLFAHRLDRGRRRIETRGEGLRVADDGPHPAHPGSGCPRRLEVRWRDCRWPSPPRTSVAAVVLVADVVDPVMLTVDSSWSRPFATALLAPAVALAASRLAKQRAVGRLADRDDRRRPRSHW